MNSFQNRFKNTIEYLKDYKMKIMILEDIYKMI
jgi:hypothetical protein